MLRKNSQFDTLFDYIQLFVTVSISIFFIFINFDKPELQSWRRDYLEITSNVQSQIQEIDNYFDLKKENDSLKIEIEKLANQNHKNNNSFYELLDLKRNLNMGKSDSLEFIFTEIIAYNLNNPFKSLTINKGSLHGIFANDPVLFKNGLVGKISDVSDNFSVVELYTDRKFDVSARIPRLGEVGTIIWDGINRFELHYIAKNIPVAVGDLIFTSGLSDIYPANIKIGSVEKIDSKVSGLFHYITVRPEINYNNLRYVSVVKRHSISQTDKILFGK